MRVTLGDTQSMTHSAHLHSVRNQIVGEYLITERAGYESTPIDHPMHFHHEWLGIGPADRSMYRISVWYPTEEPNKYRHEWLELDASAFDITNGGVSS